MTCVLLIIAAFLLGYARGVHHGHTGRNKDRGATAIAGFWLCLLLVAIGWVFTHLPEIAAAVVVIPLVVVIVFLSLLGVGMVGLAIMGLGRAISLEWRRLLTWLEWKD
jgi:Na+/citrate or Na+/malate symporter